MKEKNSQLDNFKPRKITISSTIFQGYRCKSGNDEIECINQKINQIALNSLIKLIINIISINYIFTVPLIRWCPTLVIYINKKIDKN